ncbi:MAG: ABC transporter substrate-binding protein, partial [Candidatus Dormibacteraceae bacterium]
MRRRGWMAAAVSLMALLLVAACGSSGSSGNKTIKVAFQNYGNSIMLDWMKGIAGQFEKQYPGDKVQLVPINASENAYYTKLDLSQKSASTAPDIMYEDTFLINSDVASGYVKPITKYVKAWDEWNQFYPTAQNAARGTDGEIYGVPMGTDTRALYYNKSLLQQAGVHVPWDPKNWNDILSAARAVKANDPGVVPLNVYSGTPAGEASTMQGFEMLLYGTPNPGTLYNTKTNKWVAPSPGFESALQFIQTIYSQGLAEPASTELSGNIPNEVGQQYLPQGKLAIDLDGSWVPQD